MFVNLLSLESPFKFSFISSSLPNCTVSDPQNIPSEDFPLLDMLPFMVIPYLECPESLRFPSQVNWVTFELDYATHKNSPSETSGTLHTSKHLDCGNFTHPPIPQSLLFFGMSVH